MKWYLIENTLFYHRKYFYSKTVIVNMTWGDLLVCESNIKLLCEIMYSQQEIGVLTDKFICVF